MRDLLLVLGFTALAWGLSHGVAMLLPAPLPAAIRPSELAPSLVFTRYRCGTCHVLEGDKRLSGPSLAGLGGRASVEQVTEDILHPDAHVKRADPPFSAGIMRITQERNGFYVEQPLPRIRALAEWLVRRTGAPAANVDRDQPPR